MQTTEPNLHDVLHEIMVCADELAAAACGYSIFLNKGQFEVENLVTKGKEMAELVLSKAQSISDDVMDILS